jgi:hypothetical protein
MDTTHNSQRARFALSALPDRCAPNVGELARRIGMDKLELITWARADIELARLITWKLTI